jgi:hypothetical protein
MTAKESFLPLFLGLLLLLGGCGKNSSPSSSGNGGNEPPVDVSFSSDVQPIFAAAGCASSSCHGSSESAGLSLVPSGAYDNLVNINSTEMSSLKRVLPGDAENSYLVIKLEGRQTIGARMPLNGGALSSHNIQVIKTWINEGANDN